MDTHEIVRKTIKESSDQVADAINYADAARMFYRRLADENKINRESRILEIGVGSGRLMILWDFADSSDVVQIDKYELNLERARTVRDFIREKIQSAPNATIEMGDALSLENFDDSSFDVVVSLNSSDIITNDDIEWSLEEGVEAAHRVLKPGGTFIHVRDIDKKDTIEDYVQAQEGMILGEIEGCPIEILPGVYVRRPFHIVPRDMVSRFRKEFRASVGGKFNRYFQRPSSFANKREEANSVIRQYAHHCSAQFYVETLADHCRTAFGEENVTTEYRRELCVKSQSRADPLGDKWNIHMEPGIALTQKEMLRWSQCESIENQCNAKLSMQVYGGFTLVAKKS